MIFLPDMLFVKLQYVGHCSVVAHMAYDALEDSHDVVTWCCHDIFEESSLIIIPFQCDVHHCIEKIVKISIDKDI